jgi:hypothetical protein
MLDEAKANLARIELIGLTEEYDRSLAHFCRALGWPLAIGPRLNSTSARLNRIDLYDSEMQLIREHNQLDEELYEYGAALFRDRVQCLTRPETALHPHRPPASHPGAVAKITTDRPFSSTKLTVSDPGLIRPNRSVPFPVAGFDRQPRA